MRKTFQAPVSRQILLTVQMLQKRTNRTIPQMILSKRCFISIYRDIPLSLFYVFYQNIFYCPHGAIKCLFNVILKEGQGFFLPFGQNFILGHFWCLYFHKEHVDATHFEHHATHFEYHAAHPLKFFLHCFKPSYLAL